MGIQTLERAPAKRCRLCGGLAASLDARTGGKALSYSRCESCGYIGLDPWHFPSAEEEKRRYSLHRNSASDPGYLGYLREFLDAAVLPNLSAGARILDFGSGPTPVLTAILAGAGFECDGYDPFFNPDPAWRDRVYEAILLHEVVEHLHDPARTLLELAPRLAPKGVLAVRTRFLPEDIESFQNWWYRMDSTHVGFFTPLSLERFFSPLGIHALQNPRPDILALRRT